MHSNKLILTSILSLASVSSHAATLSLADLASQTATTTQPEGEINQAVVNGSPVDSSLDVTFQFDATFKTTDPAGERVLFEFGGGGGTGTSLVFSGYNNGLRFQAEDGTNQVQTLPVAGTAIPQNQPVTITASIDLSTSTLNLFVNNTLYTTSGDVLSDWSGGNNGGFFALGGGSALKPNLTNANSAEYGPPLDSEVEATSGLRIYNDTFVNAVPEPSATALIGLAGIGLILRRRR